MPRPSKPNEPRAQRRPVDVFFRSLADNQKERAIGIILSGTGTNGIGGLRFIKSEGGIVIAQDPATAALDAQSAISTGAVDLVLPPSHGGGAGRRGPASLRAATRGRRAARS